MLDLTPSLQYNVIAALSPLLNGPGCRSSRGFCYGTEKAERVAERVAPQRAFRNFGGFAKL
eukprot:5182025-Prymnesium_polylepis.1